MITYAQIRDSIITVAGKQLVDLVLTDVYNGLEGKTSYTFKLYFRDDNKTLTNVEVDDMIKNILSVLKTEFNIELRV